VTQPTLLRALVDTRDRQVQKARMAFWNRLCALGDTGLDEGSAEQERIVRHYFEAFELLEKELNKDISETVSYYSIFPLLSAIRGIGPGLAAKLIAMIDIARSATVSSLWRYAGLGQAPYWVNEDGKIMAPQVGWQWKKKKGSQEKERVRVTPDPKADWHLEERSDPKLAGWCVPYNARLKTTCWLIAGSFLKSDSPYRIVYDEARLLYDRTHPEWVKGHKHNAALRKMSKMFLSHLWQAWREIEGLAVTRPYIDRDGQSNHRRGPEHFGWPKPLAG